jgi:hypothetical protein
MSSILPTMLTVPEAALLLSRPVRTVYRQIETGTFDLPCSKRPPRVQTKAVLKLAGLSRTEASHLLDAHEEAAA